MARALHHVPAHADWGDLHPNPARPAPLHVPDPPDVGLEGRRVQDSRHLLRRRRKAAMASGRGKGRAAAKL